MAKDKQEVICKKLEHVFRRINDAGPVSSDLRTHDFVFHMTDWKEELEELSRLFERPADGTDAEWQRAVEGFLYHAVGHLFAAAKLNGYVPDPFKALPKVKRKRRVPTATHN